MLQVDGVNQFYGGSHILRNVGFEAALGEVTVILGRNGVGKTTLLKSLMGVVPVKTGSIALDGATITNDTPYQRVRKGIGYVPQGREIFSRLTVQENLAMGMATRRGGADVPAELFELFPILKAMKARRGVRLNRRQSRPLPLTSQRARNSPLKTVCLPEEAQTPLADIARFSFSLRSIVPNVFACQVLQNTTPLATFQPDFLLR